MFYYVSYFVLYYVYVCFMLYLFCVYMFVLNNMTIVPPPGLSLANARVRLSGRYRCMAIARKTWFSEWLYLVVFLSHYSAFYPITGWISCAIRWGKSLILTCALRKIIFMEVLIMANYNRNRKSYGGKSNKQQQKTPHNKGGMKEKKMHLFLY